MFTDTGRNSKKGGTGIEAALLKKPISVRVYRTRMLGRWRRTDILRRGPSETPSTSSPTHVEGPRIRWIGKL